MRRNDLNEETRGSAVLRVLRTLFLALVAIGALAAVLGVIVAVGVVRLATSAPSPSPGVTSPTSAPVVVDTTQPTLPTVATTAPAVAAVDPAAAVPVARENAGPPHIVLNAADARLRGSMIRRDDATHDVIAWSQSDDWVSWPIEAARGELHTYAVEMTYACAPGGGGDFVVRCGDLVQTCHCNPTESWTDFKTVRLCTIEVPGGKRVLGFRPVPPLKGELMRLRRVELVQVLPGQVVADGNPAPPPAAPPKPPADGSPAVASFTLIDTAPNAPIGPMTDGMVLNLSVLPAHHMSIRADVTGTPGSVMFGLDQNAKLHLEHDAPYAINSDVNGKFIPWNPPAGDHTLTATPYAGRNGDGAAGKAMTIHFSVVANGRPRTPIVLKAQDAALHGDGIKIEQLNDGQNIGFWSADRSAEWPLPERHGTCKVVLTYAADNTQGGGDFEVSVGEQKLTGHAEPTGGWQNYHELSVGQVSIGRAKSVIIRATHVDDGKGLMNLRQVELVPVD